MVWEMRRKHAHCTQDRTKLGFYFLPVLFHTGTLAAKYKQRRFCSAVEAEPLQRFTWILGWNRQVQPPGILRLSEESNVDGLLHKGRHAEFGQKNQDSRSTLLKWCAPLFSPKRNSCNRILRGKNQVSRHCASHIYFELKS